MTNDDMKKLLENPLVLFVIMLLGGLASVVKQITSARKKGSKVTYGDYLAHWPELLVAVGYLAVSFVGMLQTGTLNIVSAWGMGYASNSMADIGTGDRVTTVAPPPPVVVVDGLTP